MIPLATRDVLAADLAQAERSRQPIAPLTAAHPEIDVVDAYEIQLINIRQRVAEGARVAGHKVGLSSLAMQQMMGVDEPDYGHLLDEMQVFEDTPVKADRYLYPRVEVEVGFILAHDLLGAARLAPTDIDITAIDAVLTRNGEVVAKGRSDAVLGNPVTAVAWLARKVESFGVRLRAGDIVLPGSCTRAIDAHPGDNFVAEFDGLGSVRLSFE